MAGAFLLLRHHASHPYSRSDCCGGCRGQWIPIEGSLRQMACRQHRERRAGCTGLNIRNDLKQAQKGVEPYASLVETGPGCRGARFPISRRKRRRSKELRPSLHLETATTSNTSIEIVVTGGGTNTFWSGGDFGYAGSASVDQWR